MEGMVITMSDEQTGFLKISGITKSYAVVKALTDVSFSIKKGEIHTILGENGAGKSTLVKIITGEESPDSGSIELDGRLSRVFTPAAAHAMGVRMVHQELAVFENLTVAENMYPDFKEKKNGRLDRKKLLQKTAEQLELFGLKTIAPNAQMASVTLAGQQMVEILRCIAADPKVLILDEPTSGLNDSEAELLMRILKRLRGEGLTIIYISHRLKEIIQISDRVTIMRDGKYVTTLQNDETLTEGDLISNMVGRDLSQSLYSTKTAGGSKQDEIVFEVRALTKKNALEPCDLQLHKGEVVGVFGLEGSGVTKLSRMMYGLERKDSGEVLVKGSRVKHMNPRGMSQRRVMYLNNNRKTAGLLLDMPVTDNVGLPILKSVSGAAGFIDFKRLSQVSKTFVGKFSISLPSLTTRPRNLSGGNQQKVMLSACLAPEPEVVIVNEPTRGIDVGAKAEIHTFLLGLAAEGMGIVVFSSEMPELMKLCDRILVMRNSAIVGEVACEDFSEQTIMRYAAVGADEQEET